MTRGEAPSQPDVPISPPPADPPAEPPGERSPSRRPADLVPSAAPALRRHDDQRVGRIRPTPLTASGTGRRRDV